MLKKTDYKGSALAYHVAGHGPVVVLLHGFGEDSFIWQHQAAFLQNDFTLIVPDLPGSGQSALVDDMSMEGLAESVDHILEQESIAQCVMIGHSMGGYITLAFAERFSNKLKGLGLFHSTAYADSEEKKAARIKSIQFIQQQGPIPFLKTSVPKLYSPATKEKHLTLIETHLQSVHYFSEAALVAYYQSMINRPDRTHLLKETHLPMLFVLGEHDTAVPLKDGLEQCHLPQLSYIHILSQSGHMGMIEEKERSNELLKEYLSATLLQDHLI